MSTSPLTDVHKHICVGGHCNLHGVVVVRVVVVLVCCIKYTYVYMRTIPWYCYNIALSLEQRSPIYGNQ